MTSASGYAGRAATPLPDPHEGTFRMTDQHTIAPHGGTLVDLLVPEQDREKLTDEAKNFPKLAVKERELSDLEMLAIGALSPLTGFQDEAEYHSILDSMHLTNGLPWTIPVTLSVGDEEAKRIGGADAIALTATDGGEPLAILEVRAVFRRDREKEAQAVFGTSELEHPGVKALNEAGDICVAGDLRVLTSPSTTTSASTGSRRVRRARSSASAGGSASSASRRATRSTARTSTSRSVRSRSSTGCSSIRSSARRRATTSRPTSGCAATRRCSRATTRRTARW
jgi:hypothetical protein